MGGVGSGVLKRTAPCGAKTRAGTPCKRSPVPGTRRCRKHGGLSPTTEENRRRETMRRGMSKLVTPADANDPEVDPFVGFVMEVRRTLGAIRFYQDMIETKIGTEEAAMWGMTKQVDQNSGEWPGSDVTSEAKPNVWISAWERERLHLTELHKIWIAAKMDERRWNAEQRHFEELDEIVTAVVLGFGKDPRDAAVRDVVRRALAGLKGKTAVELAPL